MKLAQHLLNSFFKSPEPVRAAIVDLINPEIETRWEMNEYAEVKNVHAYLLL